MPLITRSVTPLIVTSSGSDLTSIISGLEDASGLTIFVTTSIAGTGMTVLISHFDPLYDTTRLNISTSAYNIDSTNLIISTGFSALMAAEQTSSQTLSTGALTIPKGMAWTISDPTFRSLRLGTSQGETSGTIVAWAVKGLYI